MIIGEMLYHSDRYPSVTFKTKDLARENEILMDLVILLDHVPNRDVIARWIYRHISQINDIICTKTDDFKPGMVLGGTNEKDS